jgi:hypothetical protein
MQKVGGNNHEGLGHLICSWHTGPVRMAQSVIYGTCYIYFLPRMKTLSHPGIDVISLMYNASLLTLQVVAETLDGMENC